MDQVFAEYSNTTLVSTAQIAFWAQLLISITLAVSMKAVWGMQTTMQVFLFIGYMTAWPATMSSCFDALGDAVSFQFVVQKVKKFTSDGYVDLSELSE